MKTAINILKQSIKDKQIERRVWVKANQPHIVNHIDTEISEIESALKRLEFKSSDDLVKLVNDQFKADELKDGSYKVFALSCLQNYDELIEQNQRDLLIDFFLFFRNNGENHIWKTVEEFVDMYINQNK